ncbi:MAG: MFS transporter [Nocardioidaceae bacterium]
MKRRAALYGWLTSEAVSLTGTRVSMIAIPWFVLTTTGSATRTGITAFAEMAPYVVAKAAAGPWVDRIGPRKICVGTDILSVAAVGAVPLLHALGLLTFPVLVALVAVAGTLRGPGDGARQALVPAVVAAADVPMERATGLSGAIDRLASTIGATFAGVLVAMVGATTAIVVDAASFGISAVLLAATAPRQERRPRPEVATSDRAELADGWRFLRQDRVLVAMVSMIAVTNLLDAAYASVLVPVWAKDSGGGAAAMGLLFGVFSAAAVLGSIVAASYATRLPRFTTYVVAFLLGGLPRFVVLALHAPMAAILSVAVIGGFAGGFINQILGAVIYERIPAHLMGRVTSLNNSLCWAGIPVGGVLGGLAIAAVGLSPALVLAGVAYFGATLLPVFNRQWRQIDRGSGREVGEPDLDLASS